MTTASVVWLLAAIGVLIGASQFTAAIAVSIVTVAILVGFESLENVIARRRPGGKDAKDSLPPH